MSSSTSMLVYLGANAHIKLAHQLLELNPGIRFISSHIYSEEPSLLFKDNLYNKSVINFDDSIRLESGELQFTTCNDHNLVRIFESVMNDKHLPLLWTRFNNETRRRNNNEVKRYEVIYSLIKSALEKCLQIKPDSVVFSYEPHMLPMYIFKRVATALGIRVYTLTISPFVWRLFCEEKVGSNDMPLKLIKDTAKDDLFNESVTKLIQEKQSHYSIAKPFFEKRDLPKKTIMRFFNKLKINGWSPGRMLFSHLASNEYEKLSSSREEYIGKKYICIFLQYQPEQTTLPDGQLFVHLLFAIQMLYAAVSAIGVSLVIREHPATFASVFDPKWRSRGFYRAIKIIGPDIYFDNINDDPFVLIENSMAVSSVNGTVLLEALLRGKPAIAFGKHTLKGLSDDSFVDFFEDEIELRNKIVKSTMLDPQDVINNIEKYLYDVYPSTFGSNEYPGNTAMTQVMLKESRFEALRQVVQVVSKK